MKVSAAVTVLALSGLCGLACSSKSALAVKHDASVAAGGSPGVGGAAGTGGSTANDTGGASTGGATGSGGAGSGGSGAGGARLDVAATADGGTTADATVDLANDSATRVDAASSCESELGGICSTFGNDCVVCPPGRYVHPTSAGCAGNLWCCRPTSPVSNPCTSAGGVCIANGAECPAGWDRMRTSCGSDANPICCQPRESCAPYPQACVALGGVCAPNRWSPCPPGTEPHTLDDQLGCGGWCCVDAPPSTCADGLDGHRGMCIPGACTGCFANVTEPGLTCEGGRSCCTDICD